MEIRVVNTPQVRMRRWAAATVIALAALIIAPQAFADDAKPGAPAASETYVVGQGETLWSIAGAVTEPGGDVRDTIAVIESMNMLPNSNIAVGQQLLVPVQS